MPPETKSQLERSRRMERRLYARASFFFLLGFASVLTLALLFHPDRVDMANSIDRASGVLTGIMTALVAIIMSYLGASTIENVVATRANAGQTDTYSSTVETVRPASGVKEAATVTVVTPTSTAKPGPLPGDNPTPPQGDLFGGN